MSELVIAIVGRPNVGKSSLANKLIGRREAIVHDSPGVTRDRSYHHTDWSGRQITVIDTGGIYNHTELNTSIAFQKHIEAQARIAVTEADAIILLTDGKEGMHPLDKEVALLLKRSSKPVFLAVNKMETNKRDLNVYDFYTLGFDPVYPISAITGMGVADLLDIIVTTVDKGKEEKKEDTAIKVAIVGKPNVGKSSLLNTLLGKERSIVSPISGTTRDAIDEEFMREQTLFRFIDTAGIRKKNKVVEDVEYYSVQRSIDAIERCDIAILILDATKLVEEQDQKIAGLIQDNNKGCIIVVNKWDLIEKDSTTINRYEALVRDRLKFLAYCPVIFISATEKTRTYDLYQELITVYKNGATKVGTSDLNNYIKYCVEALPPRAYKSKQLKISYVTQTRVRPPMITFFVNNPTFLHFAYKRYLENKLRAKFSFYGNPIILQFRSKSQKK
jgi:GTP-binding protein